MSHTVTTDMAYSGSEYDVAILSGLEMFQLYKLVHSISDANTTSYNNATGLTSYDLEKLTDSSFRYTEVWESEAAYDAWYAGFTAPTLAADWTRS